MIAPKKTSEAQWALSLTLERAVNVAMPYTKGGTNALSLYSEAITVAMANTEDECPEGKDRLEEDAFYI